MQSYFSSLYHVLKDIFKQWVISKLLVSTLINMKVLSSTKSTKRYHSFYIFTVGILLFLWIWFSLSRDHIYEYLAEYEKVTNFIQDWECVKNTISEVVSGTSMSPLLSDGQEIEVQQYIPECMTIERGDLVIYDYAQDIIDANPVVKRVVGKWGDAFEYMSGKIYINGDIQKNSSWVEYHIDSNMLALYAHDYPIIPPRTLLILWEIPTGSRDSSAFWFISEDEIDGKVILP